MIVRYGADTLTTRRFEDYSDEEKRAVKEWGEERKKFVANPEDKEVLNQWGRLPFNTDLCFGLRVGDETVSYSAWRFSTKKQKNAWGRYTFWHFAYTPDKSRRRGYAKQLFAEVASLAVQQGYVRVKSLCQSRLGVILHQSLGHDFWGRDKKNGSLVVDSPLNRAIVFPDGIPIEARCAINPHKMIPEEISEHIRAVV